MKEEVLRQYEESLDSLEAVKAALENDLLQRLADAGLTVNAVLARVKSRESLKGKLHRPDRTYSTIEQVHDLVGLRVVTYFEDGVDEVAKVIEDAYEVDPHNSVDKGQQLNPTQFGYRSLHYVCEIPRRFAVMAEPAPRLKFEIQVRSILQHAWAQMEHDLGYKSKESIPLAFRRRFSRLAGLLEIVDEEFVALRRALQSYSEDLMAGLESVPIDSMSLRSFVTSARVREADAAVAQWLRVPLSDSVFYPEYLSRMLSFTGLRSIGDLNHALQARAADVEACLPAYFEFSKSMWGLRKSHVKSVERGYSLLFLAHILLIRELRGENDDPLERVTAFYRTLDYPDEPTQARQAARTLLQAFHHWP